VDSPQEQFDVGMQDLLANLGTATSAELMLTDESKQDDLWDMLFGRSNSLGLDASLPDAAAAAAAAGGGGLAVSMAGPAAAAGAGDDAPMDLGLDPAAAAAAPRPI
jgi:hypothetical protein